MNPHRVEARQSGYFHFVESRYPRFAASPSYRRTPDLGPGQAPISSGPDWIPPYPVRGRRVKHGMTGQNRRQFPVACCGVVHCVCCVDCVCCVTLHAMDAVRRTHPAHPTKSPVPPFCKGGLRGVLRLEPCTGRGKQRPYFFGAISMPDMPPIPPTAALSWLSESIRKFAEVTTRSPAERPARISA